MRSPVPLLLACCALGAHAGRTQAPQRKRSNPIKALGQRGPIGATTADCVAGGLAGFVGYSFATPLEQLKTMCQAEGCRTRDAFSNVLSNTGKRGFFKAWGPMMTSGVPYSMILYGVYRPLRDWTHAKLAARGDGKPASREAIFVADMAAAALAEGVGLFAFIPGELVAKRMMADPTRYTGVMQAFGNIVKTEGVFGLFTGFGACLVRDVPYTMIQFAMFDALATQVSNTLNADGGPPSFTQALGIGAAAAVAAATLTLPIDVLKSQMQLATVAQLAAAPLGMFSMMTQLIAKEGPQALFRGYGPYVTINICKWSSSQAVFTAARGDEGCSH